MTTSNSEFCSSDHNGIQDELDNNWDDWCAIRNLVANTLRENALDILFDDNGTPVDGYFRSLKLYEEMEVSLLQLNRNRDVYGESDDE